MGDAAEVGVGTLIVFIAMVLVAAVAAAVLISTSGNLQQRAAKTGQSATEEVSSNLLLSAIYGNVSSNQVVALHFHITLAAGAQTMDLSKVKLRYTDGTNAPVMLTQSMSAPSSSTYRTIWLRGAGANNLMASTDLVNAIVDLSSIGAAYKLDARTDVQARFIPEAGAQLNADFRAPNNYGGHAYVSIR